jgi:hypothetical protein
MEGTTLQIVALFRITSVVAMRINKNPHQCITTIVTGGEAQIDSKFSEEMALPSGLVLTPTSGKRK